MRLVRVIPTPWAPYSVMFSRDGTRLAIGGGSWYGGGGILLVDLGSGASALHPAADFPEPNEPSVSGVCFSVDDRFLAASTWESSHHYSPTYLFSVSELDLSHEQMWTRSYRDVCPTGVLLLDRHIVTRNHNARELDRVVAMWDRTNSIRSPCEEKQQHLTSNRLVVIRDTVITAGRDPGFAWGEDNAFHETRPPDGLLLVPLRTGAHQSPETIPVQNGRRVTAIAATQAGDGFLTGGRRGKLSRWSWKGQWQEQPLRGSTNRRNPRWADLDVTWATYNANSIVGICSLCDGDGWLSVSAGGELCLWEKDRLVESWDLPEPGTPRTIAAHPDRPWIAIGIKKGGFGRPESAVAIVEVSPFRPCHSQGPWSSTVVRLAEAFAGGVDCRLPLSDALEEAGHPDLAAHFRERRWHGDNPLI